MGPNIIVNNHSGMVDLQDQFGIFMQNDFLSNFVAEAKSNPANPNLENNYLNLITNRTEVEIYSGIDWSKIPSEWSEGFIYFKHNNAVLKSIAIFNHLNVKV